MSHDPLEIDEATPRGLGRFIPHVAAATFLVAVLPVLIVLALEARGHLRSFVWSAIAGMSLSASFSLFGSFVWTRRGGSRDLVYGDLMVWGFLHRLRTEKRLERATRLLGLDGSGWGADGAEIGAEQQAKILEELAAALEARDPYTHGHTRRVTRHSFMIARAMGLPEEEIEKIRVAASVHDVGKVQIPLDVLNKPGKLSDEEFALIKEHSARGAEMVSSIHNAEITAMVRHHHERIDGRGYPDGLSGTEIPLGARIMAVADTFDAITSTRAYRSAAGHRKGIEVLREVAGTQLDRDAVTAFLHYYSGRNSVAWWATLTTLPQRLAAAFVSWLRGVGASGLIQGAAAVGTAAAVAGSVVAPPTLHDPRLLSRPHATSESVAGSTADGALGTDGSASTTGGPEDLSVGGSARPDQDFVPEDRERAFGDDGIPGTSDDPGTAEGGGSSSDGDAGGSDEPSGPDGDTTDTGGDTTGTSDGTGTSGDPGTSESGGGSSSDRGGGGSDEPSGAGGGTTDPIGDTVDTIGDIVDDTTDTVEDTVGGLGLP